MYKRGIRRMIYSIVLISLLSFMIGCQNASVESAIISQLPNDYIDTFYGEGVQTQYIQDEPIQTVHFKEWKGNESLYRVDYEVDFSKDAYEVYSGIKSDKDVKGIEIKYMYNEDQMMIYYADKNEYAIKKMSLEDAVEASLIQGINTLIVDGSPKAYTTSIITELSKSYELSIEDDIKINGKRTQHIIAKGKKEGNKNRVLQYWIDQESWIIIKAYEQIGNYAISFEYLKTKINPRIKAEIFKEMPSAEGSIIYLGDNLEKCNKVISFNEAREYFKSPIYYLEQNEETQLKSSQYIETISQAKGIIEFTYELPKDRELIIQNAPCNSMYSRIDIGGEEIQVGPYKAKYYEFNHVKYIEIMNLDVVCTMFIKHGEIAKDEFIAIASKLVKTE